MWCKRAIIFFSTCLLLCSCTPKLKVSPNIKSCVLNGEIEKAKARTKRHLPKVASHKARDEAAWALPTLALLETVQGDHALADKHWRQLQDHYTLLGVKTLKFPSTYYPYQYESDLAKVYRIFALQLNPDHHCQDRAQNSLKEICSITPTQTSARSRKIFSLLHYMRSCQLSHQGHYQAAKQHLFEASDHLDIALINLELNHLARQSLKLEKSSESDPSDLEITKSTSSIPTASKLLIFIHQGIIPPITTHYSPSTVATKQEVKQAIDDILAPYKQAEVDNLWSSIRFVPHPQFSNKNNTQHLQYKITLDERAQQLYEALDISEIALDELEERTPGYIARNIAQLQLSKMGTKKRFGQLSELHTMLADTALFIANSRTHADCRHWVNLPEKISICTCEVSPGEHVITLQELTTGKQHKHQFITQVKDLCFLHVFFSSPAMVRFVESTLQTNSS